MILYMQKQYSKAQTIITFIMVSNNTAFCYVQQTDKCLCSRVTVGDSCCLLLQGLITHTHIHTDITEPVQWRVEAVNDCHVTHTVFTSELTSL